MEPQVGSSSYDVFINFRGEDTRNTFVCHLHKALNHRGIHAFIDSESLWKGEDIGPALLRAIENSKLSIAVLSERYVESTWCLNELAHILECHKKDGQIIFPIFFKVTTSNVKNQTGPFEISSQRHEKEATGTLQRWKDTLRAIGDKSGWVVSNRDDESELIANVVQKIWIQLSIVPLIDIKHPVGLEPRVESVLSLLSNTPDTISRDVQFIGICGQGGIGKTAIATVVYNCISKNFSRSCFIGDVRERASQPNGIVCLQQDLLYGIFGVKTRICSSQEGSRLLKTRYQNTKILLILDDVGYRNQLDALACDPIWFGSESRIIVTTRDQGVLIGVPKNNKDIFEPNELNEAESLRLFSLNAFSTDKPPKEYIDLSIDIVDTTGGLPLALEVLGCDLSMTKDKEVWESKLRMSKQLPDDSVYERLKTTFDDLHPIEKSMFLDAACFFIGWEVKTIISIWKACGFEPICRMEVLKRKSLLKFKKSLSFAKWGKEILWMHDQLREMGRRIAYNQRPENPNYHSRLWSCENFMKGYKVNEIVERIILSFHTCHEIPIHTKHFANMHELRLLQVDGVTLEGSFDHLPSRLRWLNWNYCPLEKLHADHCHEELVVLNLSNGSFTRAWKKWPEKKLFQQLKVLQLNYNRRLSESPDFSGFPHLEKLDLSNCSKLVNLHESIGELQQLVYLDLGYCHNLKKLPNSICRLSSLKKFILEKCSSLEELPNNIFRLSSLQKLDLSGCKSLRELLGSIGGLKDSLTELSLVGLVMEIEAVPDGDGPLKKLEVLDLYSNYRLKHLPRSTENTTSLRCLKLSGRLKVLQIKLPSSLIEFHTDHAHIENLPLAKYENFEAHCGKRSLRKSREI